MIYVFFEKSILLEQSTLNDFGGINTIILPDINMETYLKTHCVEGKILLMSMKVDFPNMFWLNIIYYRPNINLQKSH